MRYSNYLSCSLLLIILAFIFIITCKDEATEPEKPLPPTELHFSPTWSEANGLIAYVHIGAPVIDHPDTTGIYVIRPDGTDKRSLFLYKLTYNFSVAGLDWASDGQSLVAALNGNIIKINYPDGEIDTLTTEGSLFFPVWSPDDRSIAYEINGGDLRGIYIMQADGSEKRRVIEYGVYVDWPYPDSLIYTNFDSEFASKAICIADTSGVYRREICQTNTVYTGDPQAKMHIDTRRIAFNTRDYWGIMWFLDPSAVEPRKIREYAMSPSFSPDGDQIVFVNTENGNGNVYIINWDGSGLRQLTF